MIREKIEAAFLQKGYRFWRGMPDNFGVFYQYGEEGVHAVVAVDMMQGHEMTVQQHAAIEERIYALFSQPVESGNRMPEGIPEGAKICHVEILTLLIGTDAAQIRTLCAMCGNTWGYLPAWGQLLIYENQPGEFWGLRSMLETLELTQGMRADRESSQNSQAWNLRELPYTTIVLAAINVLVYLILELLGDTRQGSFIGDHGGMYPTQILYDRQWWRILTAGFIHFGLAHLLNNMVMLCCVGSRLERAIGHVRMLVVYLISLIGGGLLSYFMMLHTRDFAVSAGASGAVFGIIGGLLWAVIFNRGKLEGLTTRGVLLMIALSLYFGFVSLEVDQWAHVGGMLTGFLSTAILYHRNNQKC
ncbi:MAG: rhomboid family intramembrane serine protease [Roseburia sp.]|nr:rhomboid family intramembrane serine protease [Roseburia sp.]